MLLTLNGTLVGELALEQIRGFLGNVPQGSVNSMHFLKVSAWKGWRVASRVQGLGVRVCGRGGG